MSNAQNKMSTLQKSFLFPRLLKLMMLKDWPAAAVPLISQFNEVVPELCRLPYDYLYRDDPQAMAECSLLVWEYLGVDNAFAVIDSYNTEIEAMGGKIMFFKDHIPDIDRKDFFVKGKGDLEKLKFKGLESGRYPYLIKYYQTFTELSGLDQFPEVSAPWSMACNLFGMENLLIATMTEPGFVHALMDKILSDVIIPAVDALKATFPDANLITFPDAWCSPPMVTVSIIKEFVEPYIARLKDYCTGLGAGFGWGIGWVTGLPKKDREYMIDLFSSATGYVYGFPPEVDELTPEYFREYATEKMLTLALGIAPSFMQLATPQEVHDKVRHYVLVGKKGPTPLALLCGCIGPHVPLDNVRMLVNALNTYGAVGAEANTPLAEVANKQTFEEFLRDKIADNAAGYTFSWIEKSGYAYLPGQGPTV